MCTQVQTRHDAAVQFLSDEWLRAMDAAARDRTPPDDDPLAGVSLSIEHVIVDGPSWRLVIDDGACRVDAEAPGDADVRLTTSRDTAEAIAAGRRSALEAFIAGELRMGGDTRVLLTHREALEVLGDLFASVKADTSF